MSLFSGLHLHTIGTFGKGTTQASVHQKITANGGTVDKKFDIASTTHVICTQSEWDGQGNKAAAIAEANAAAEKGGEPPVWVVSLSWVLDSITAKKLEDEEAYSVVGGAGPPSPVAAAPAPVKPKAAAKGKGKGKGKRAASESEEEDEPAPAPKMVKVTQKGGSPPVDSRFPQKTMSQVYAGPDGVYYDAMLNQTDVKNNANKFYVVQVLKSDTGNQWWTFNVWGRVGENGQNKTFGPWSSAGPAIAEFEKKFKDKSRLTWANRLGPPSSGKYTFLERAFDDDEEDDSEVEEETNGAPSPKKARTDPLPAAESSLPPTVQSLMQMIFNVSTLNQTMSSFEYDANKLPLGKLSKQTLDQGYAALKEIAALLNTNAPASSYIPLTNRYYSLVPHSFGRNIPPTINSHHTLKRELDLIDALSQLKITSELMATAKGPESHLHPLDAQYKNLGLKRLDPIAKTDNEFEVLTLLLDNTKGVTHTAWDLELVDAFKVCRDKDEQRFEEAGYGKLKGGVRRLLWHGSRSSNYGGILSQGLRIAPPEAPVSGYMFGKGLYLASMATKSAGYCFHSISNNEGLLMLVEAQLGPQPFYVKEQAEYEAEESCKKSRFLATWGVGRTQPAKWEDASKLSSELKGVQMPSTTVPHTEKNKTSQLQYDEFITYSTSQVKIRYLLRVRFKNRY